MLLRTDTDMLVMIKAAVRFLRDRVLMRASAVPEMVGRVSGRFLIERFLVFFFLL